LMCRKRQGAGGQGGRRILYDDDATVAVASTNS